MKFESLVSMLSDREMMELEDQASQQQVDLIGRANFLEAEQVTRHPLWKQRIEQEKLFRGADNWQTQWVIMGQIDEVYSEIVRDLGVSRDSCYLASDVLGRVWAQGQQRWEDGERLLAEVNLSGLSV